MAIGHSTPVFDCAELVGDFENGSAEWHEAREGSLGGSQVGAALGLNPWESAYTLWLKLTKQIESNIPSSMSMRLGTKLETPILEIFAEEHPELSVFTTGTYRSKSHPWRHANLDGLFEAADGLGVVEVKYSADYWPELPKHYEYQVRWYMHVLGLKRGVVVALAGSSYREFWLDADDFVTATMVSRIDEFWNRVVSGIAPDWDGSKSTYESVRQLNKDIVPGDVELGDDGFQLLSAFENLKAAQYEYNLRASRVLSGMGDTKYGVLDGERIVSRQLSSAGTPFLKLLKGK